MHAERRRVLVEGLVILWVCLIILLCFPMRVHSVPATPPATIVLDEKLPEGRLDGAKGEVALPMQVRFGQKVEVVEVSAVLSRGDKDPALLESKPVWKGRVAAGKQDGLKIPVKVEGPGVYFLDIRLQGRIEEGNGFSDRKVRYLLVNDKGEFRFLTSKEFVREKRQEREERFRAQLNKAPDKPDIRLLFLTSKPVGEEIDKKIRPHDVPKDQQLLVRPSRPSEEILKYAKDQSGTAWAPEDPITVRGRLTFLDYDGAWRPLVNVSVYLWDDDTFGDDYLGSVATDWSGNWSFTVNNDDGWLQDGRDIYYSFALENTRIRVQDCDGIDSTYEWSSATHDNLSDGTVLDFGTETGVEHPLTMQIWNHLNLAWNHAVTAGGQDPGFVDSCYPEDGGTHWDRTWEEIDIEAEFNDGPDIVTHEYGHAIMWYAYGEDNPSPGGAHTFDDCPQNAGLAWSEGWASGFMLSARPADGEYTWHEGTPGRNIENFNSACQTGDRNEGRVAAAINDMRDSPDDCNGGNLNRGRADNCDSNNANRVPLSTMLHETLWGSWHSNVMEFWTSLSGELPTAQRTPAQEIMYYNWMPVTEPGSGCMASKIAAQKSRDPDTLLGGLRSFRDQVLRGFGGGQQIINIYYRNSPEMAVMLLRNPALLERSLKVMSHFSKVGHMLTDQRAAEQYAAKDQPLLGGEIDADVEEVLAAIDKQGSPELKQDLLQVRQMLDKLRGLTMRELQGKISQTKAKQAPVARHQLQQSSFNPKSSEALKELQDKGETPAQRKTLEPLKPLRPQILRQ